MKVLIFGITGMLGHKLYQELSKSFTVYGTLRGDSSSISKYGFYKPDRIFSGVNAREDADIENALDKAKPDVVVNCIGVVKSLVEQQGMLPTLWLNALFPHLLHKYCKERNVRLIHISTDCVFSGKTGLYKETDLSDAEDVYGKSKYLGEVTAEGALTIRTSVIGRELSSANGLVEWFLSNSGGKVQGYSTAIFSGFPTLHLSGIIADIINKQQNLNGLYHVAAAPIDKFTLLSLIKKQMGLNIDIEKYDGYKIDRSLDYSKFTAATGFTPPDWDRMIKEFAEDAKQYKNWR